MKYIKEYNSDSYNNRIRERDYIEDLFLEYADAWGISEVDDVQEYEEEIINDELVTSICDTTIHTSGNGIYSYEINIAFKKGFLKKTKRYLLEELPDDFESDMLSFRNRLQKLGYFTEKHWGGSAQLYRITIVGNSISLKES